jgi:hypothetical protein
MQTISKPIDVSRSWPYFVVLMVLVIPAFWPTYFGLGLGSSGRYVHFHAATAATWMALLILQPLLIRNYKYELHRRIGYFSFILAPLMVVSMLLLANFRIRAVTADAYPQQTYFLYLQFMLAFLFAVSYALAMIYRKDSDVHARFMVCTGLTLIDPVFGRLIAILSPTVDQYEQQVTFTLTYLVFLVMIWLERKNRNARWVFPLMLGVFFVVEAPAMFRLTGLPVWQSVADWYRSLPLT